MILSKPQIGSVWEHTSGNKYIVLLISNTDSTKPNYPETVIYKGFNGKVWSRPLSDWCRSMTLIHCLEHDEYTLLKSFIDVEAFGSRLGVLKEHLWPVAESLVEKSYLIPKKISGLYYLKG